MLMEQQDLKRLALFYQESLKVAGERDNRSVHWVDDDGQMIHYSILSQIANLNNKRVLDVGCGIGDLYNFYRIRNMQVEYTGIDIVLDFIKRAKERFPEGRFLVQDLFTVADKYDYVLASEALSFKINNTKEYYFAMIRKMYDIATYGVSFNMLNRNHKDETDTYMSYDPNEVANYCKTIAKNVKVVTDFVPTDFTVYMYK